MRWQRIVLWALAVVAVLVILAIAIGGWMAFRQPLTLERWASRAGLARAGFERQDVATPVGEVSVWSAGEGRPVALLHGAGDHAGAWAGVAPRLLDDRLVLVPDLPGHDPSEPEDGPLSVGTIVDGVAAVLEQRSGDEPAVVVGNSLGGWVALLLALERPELVERAIVVNGGGTAGPTDPSVLVPGGREEARELLEVLGFPDADEVPDAVLDDLVRSIPDGPVPRIFSAPDIAEHALDGRLGDVSVPVDLIWGAEDRFFPVAYAEATRDALPAARLTTIPGCGHSPPRYCPDRFTAELERVLTLPPPRSEPPEQEPETSAAGAPPTEADR